MLILVLKTWNDAHAILSEFTPLKSSHNKFISV